MLEIKGDVIVPMPAIRRVQPTNLTNPIINNRLSKINCGRMATKKTRLLNVYTDGGSRGNPGSAAIAFIIEDEKDSILFKHSEFIGRTTNNVAEYTALIKALKRASVYSSSEVFCFSDSEFMVDQLTGKDKVKKEHIKKLYSSVRRMEKEFKHVNYFHLSRENPKIASVDRLVNKELNKLIK